MRTLVGIFTIILMLSCNSKIDASKLPLLNGYWEIEQVVFPDGSTKSYTVNASIDFIELNGQEGFRKKMQPQFDGTFKTSNDAEQFTITTSKNRMIIQYSNSENSWEETLIELTDDRFEVMSESGVAYHYKRYQPLELN